MRGGQCDCALQAATVATYLDRQQAANRAGSRIVLALLAFYYLAHNGSHAQTLLVDNLEQQNPVDPLA